MEEVLEDKELETALKRLKEREGSAKGSTDGVEEQEAPVKDSCTVRSDCGGSEEEKKKHGNAEEEAAERAEYMLRQSVAQLILRTMDCTGNEGGWFDRESRGQTLRRLLLLKNQEQPMGSGGAAASGSVAQAPVKDNPARVGSLKAKLVHKLGRVNYVVYEGD
eukprot:4552262-Amphidinium_carterae.1